MQIKRYNKRLHQLLNQLLLEHFPARGVLATIAAVALSPDLSLAKVYVSFLPDEPAEVSKLLTQFNAQKHLLRKGIAQQLGSYLRKIPKLRFIQDDGPARAISITRLLKDEEE
jgi:ribosome-binding factor A